MSAALVVAAFAASASALLVSHVLMPKRVGRVHLGGHYMRLSLEHDGRCRTYGVYRPRSGATAEGLVVVLHGSRGSGAGIRRWTGNTFDRLADELGIAIAYPDGWKGHWNDCRKAGAYAAKALNVDDVGFIDRLVSALAPGGRVAVVGYSNGGYMGLRWAMQGARTPQGLVMAGASVPVDANLICTPGRMLPPALLVAGTADRICPYDGGEVTLLGSPRGAVRSAVDAAGWLAASGSATAAIHAGVDWRSGRRKDTWTAPGGGRAELLTLEGGGHTLPQPWMRFPRLLGRTDHGIDVAECTKALLGWEARSDGSRPAAHA